MSVPTEADVVVVGSGGAGTFAACILADLGHTVVVLERSDKLGGTTAISGGLLWMPANPLMERAGIADSQESALTYLRRLTMGRVDDERLVAFVRAAPEVVEYLVDRTPVGLEPVVIPDYHAEWPGGSSGRALDNVPFDTAAHEGLGPLVREGTQFPPITYQEFETWRWPERFDWELIADRMMNGVRTMGGALAAALVAGAMQRRVRFELGVRARSLVMERGMVGAVAYETDEGRGSIAAKRAVVLASGGFEWNAPLKRRTLRGPELNVVSPPWNEGDALLMATAVGASVENMEEANWVPTFNVPGEEYDGRPMARLASASISLPGSIVVNRAGRRFMNESMNYYDQGRAFHQLDPVTYEYPNIPGWTVFDDRFKRSYPAASVMPSDDAPGWFARGDTVEELAANAGIDGPGLAATVVAFNQAAAAGVDPDFHRGEFAHDRFNGDPDRPGNPCLAPLDEPPFYAVKVVPGITGTKGGLRTDLEARVLDAFAQPIPGLYAVGSATSSIMGPSYAGSGANLGPGLVEAYLAAHAIGKRT
jgi:succinate dehydrogenase/fumarate reductase flavoprotein subunit